MVGSSDTGGGRRAVRVPGTPPSAPPAVRTRRAVTLLAMSLIVPGSAQLTAGNVRIGRLVTRTWLGAVALAALGGLTYLADRATLLSIVTSTFVLSSVAVVLFVGAVLWPLLVIDAWRLSRPHLLPRRARLAVSCLTLMMVLVTSVPLVATGRRVWAGADFIDGVFHPGPASAAHQGRFNVLLMGGDAGNGRIGVRPDSLTLVSIDAETGRPVLFSLPRNLEDVPFPPGTPAAKAMPEGWSCGDSCLLNGLYTWGSEHRDLFPGEADPGAAAMKQAVTGITGLSVNYYVLIDLRGFSNLIDAMGGVDVRVGQPIPIGGGTSRITGWIRPGNRHLDGYHALWYARSRHGASDYERMARQRCVMDAMLRQLDPGTVLAKFQGLAAAGKNIISTDIPATHLGTLLDLAVGAKGQKASSVQFVPPLINPARPDLRLIRHKVAVAVKTSEDASASQMKVVPKGTATSSRPTDRMSRSPNPSQPASAPAEVSDVSSVCGVA
ncbi:MAG: polyisoprenyl-teichoic acid--peptidoglycan teichoic acid transferase [Actinomycetota bacterium]|nr:polyisoprenyl-teichoic acid--peptidoglycan teichoic acid transferase [Actinomycetota bacterium]